MVKYSCEKCGKEFTQKGVYIKHINKKKNCIIEKVGAVAEMLNEIKCNENTPVIIPELKEDGKIKFIDLFCGIGSFHYSFKKLNWECIMSCDIDKAVKETYKENYGLLPLGDISEIEPQNIPNYDILCAGFPCQPFSQCGQHKGQGKTIIEWETELSKLNRKSLTISKFKEYIQKKKSISIFYK